MNSISICPKGHVSFHFDKTTIHLSLEEFFSFVNLLSKSMAEFGMTPPNKEKYLDVTFQ